MKLARRSAFKGIIASIVGIGGLGLVAQAETLEEKKINPVDNDQEIPLFSGSRKHGDLIYVAGKGAHFDGDIKAHTTHVLDEMEKELVNAGSSMANVLKVNVYLHDLNDYAAMNEAYRGRFGNIPPVRTTIAVYGGVPGNSLVEMDCIAHI
jgi:enamine deaminase RidA (YjgF/YER057c/UK114 family)